MTVRSPILKLTSMASSSLLFFERSSTWYATERSRRPAQVLSEDRRREIGDGRGEGGGESAREEEEWEELVEAMEMDGAGATRSGAAGRR